MGESRNSGDSPRLGYPDLQDADFVYEALLGHGMFSHKLPPCFSSEAFFRYIYDTKGTKVKRACHCPVQYWELRHTNVPRDIGIPHPESYAHLCQVIRGRWNKINEHVGKAHPRKSFVHVRKIVSEGVVQPHIFEMNDPGYKQAIRREEQDRIQEYSLNAEYRVEADVAQCYPSIYSHSIPWAIRGKPVAKKSRKKKSSYIDLDKAICCVKEGETDGLLIGPHTSNVISEIVLTQVDKEMLDKGHESYIRHIDDYKFYAENLEKAEKFLTDLGNILKIYNLSLNAAKVKIIPLPLVVEEHWISDLRQFVFNREEYSFNFIIGYLDAAFCWAQREGVYSPVLHAMKKIAKINLNKRARYLYVLRILHLCLRYPYLTPHIEKFVLDKFYTPEESKCADFFRQFVMCLLDEGVRKGMPSCVSFAFYFARKYEVCLDEGKIKEMMDDLINMRDCVALVLAAEYLSCINAKNLHSDLRKKIEESFDFTDKRERDQYWLLVLEVFGDKCGEWGDNFLAELKENEISFLQWN